eukprot:482950-Pleurochrysis_carterae.AAC.1
MGNGREPRWAFNIPSCSEPSMQRATFMMTSRNGKNRRGERGFVKKSARLSVLRTNGTVSSSSSTFSREIDGRFVIQMEWRCVLVVLAQLAEKRPSTSRSRRP